MTRRYIKTALIFAFAVVLILLPATAISAAITGFVVTDGNNGYHQYCYEELLDSYALKLLGSPDGLYEDFLSKTPYALIHSAGGYLDYADILDQYALMIVRGSKFDLAGYAAGSEVKKAQMPASVKLVSISTGMIARVDKIVNPEGAKPDDEVVPKTALLGDPVITAGQAGKWAESRNAAQRFVDVAPLYWKYGAQTGIRPELLYAQAAVATNFGFYTGVVPADYNNWAGIRTADATGHQPEDHEKFLSAEDGVRAHYNHVAAYMGLEPIGETHGRYTVIMEQSWAGTIKYLEELSGRWAPSPDHHTYITALVGQMVSGAGDVPSPNPGSDNGENPPDEAPQENENIANKSVIVNVAVLNFRSGPGTEHKILSQVTRGMILHVKEEQGDWLQVIRPGGQQGWVHGDYVLPINLTGKAMQGKTIVIDPGHGGRDPGATGITGLREKDLNLIVAQQLVALLNQAGANVVMTRSDDRTVSNTERVNIANDAGAELFLSIHANAYSDPLSNGTETHYYSQDKYSAESLFFSEQLQREMVNALGMRNRGVKTSSFFVLTKTELPAALVELGFLTNMENEAQLRDPEVQEKAALALFLGIEAYFKGTR